MVVCEDGAVEETIRKHYGDILTDPEILPSNPSRLDKDSIDFLVREPPERWVLLLEPHIWRVTSVPQP